MKKIFTFLFALALSSVGFAQREHNCGTDHKHAILRQQDPEFQQRAEDYNRQIKEIIAARKAEGNRDETVYIIPIVFHIVHNFGPENISDEQIYDQVRILNEDFRKLNEDTSDIIDIFKPIAADARVEFRLPTKDFEGNCTNGIDRIASVETYVGDDGSKLNAWPRDRYLNVWVVTSMEDGVAGYAYYPSAVPSGISAMRDGIIIRHQYIGSIGTGSPGNSRALTHEIGHWLNLQHVWGDNNSPGLNCGDDDVEDTPESIGWDNCNLNGSVCNAGVIENVQNYMEYSYCSNMFSAGQVERLRAALTNPLAGRSTLWTAENLAFTGTDGWNNATCAPQADFYTDKPVACIGEDITFFDYSSDSDVLFFEWYFDDGTSSTDPNPTKSFTTSGWHAVTLSVSNWYGLDITYKERAVYVIPEPNVLTGLVTENFQNQQFFNNNYISRNFDFNESAWTWNNTVGYDDQACAALNAYDFESDFIDTGDNDIDELIFPAMDLSNVTGGGPTISFKYAYATQATDLAGVTDNFILYSSRNCGLTWQARNPSSPSQGSPAITGANLVSAGNSTTSFVPTSQADWKTITYNIPNTLWEPNVLFKIVFTTGEFANNLYIDNININGIVGVDEINAEVAGLNVYPNPANNSTQLSFTLSTSQDVTVIVTDLSGRVVSTELFANRVAGGNIIDLPLDAIADGMYMVSIKSENAIATQRLVVRK